MSYFSFLSPLFLSFFPFVFFPISLILLPPDLVSLWICSCDDTGGSRHLVGVEDRPALQFSPTTFLSPILSFVLSKTFSHFLLTSPLILSSTILSSDPIKALDFAMQ